MQTSSQNSEKHSKISSFKITHSIIDNDENRSSSENQSIKELEILSDDDSFKQFKGSESDSKSDAEIIELEKVENLISKTQNSQIDKNSEYLEA